MHPFTIEESKMTAFAIPLDSAVGGDGFSSAFFNRYWAVIGQSIIKVANEFLC